MESAQQEKPRSTWQIALSAGAKQRLWALLVIYCAFIAVVVLVPSAAFPSAVVNWVSDHANAIGVPDQLLVGHRVEFALNILMIAPISALGSLLWRSWGWRDWTGVAFVSSGAVELGQGLLLPDRSATFVDVCANTAGALLGAVTAWLVLRLGERR